MIEFPITLTSGGSVCLPGHASALALGYAKNKSVYRLAVTATGEWAGLTIRAFWHVPGGWLCGRARQRDRPTRQWLHHL